MITSIALFFSPIVILDVLYRQDILFGFMDFFFCLYFQIQHILFGMSVSSKDFELAKYVVKIMKVKILITFTIMVVAGYKLTDLYYKLNDNNDDDMFTFINFIITVCVLGSQVLFTLPGSVKVNKLLLERKEIQGILFIKKLTFLL